MRAWRSSRSSRRGCAPAYADLDGLLAGPGRLARRGDAARLSVLLPDPARWRVDALLAGLAELDLAGEVVSGERGLGVRTRFAVELAPLAVRWTRGARAVAPVGLRLDGARLRWWLVAAGAPDPLGVVLVLGDDEASWGPVGAALAAAGIPGTLVRPRRPGRLEHPAYRIVGGRRLTRLAELVGPPPPDAAGWPGHASGS